MKNVNLHLKKGEIIGISGLMGSGRTELALSIFGNPKNYKLQGHLEIQGAPKVLRHTSDAIKAGIAYVTEDRKGDGLFLLQDIKSNVSAAYLKGISTNGVLNLNEEVKVGKEYKDLLNIKASSLNK